MSRAVNGKHIVPALGLVPGMYWSVLVQIGGRGSVRNRFYMCSLPDGHVQGTVHETMHQSRDRIGYFCLECDLKRGRLSLAFS